MEELFFKQGWGGIIALALSFVFIQLWKFYAQRKDYQKGDITRQEIIRTNMEQNAILKELVTILKAHDERAIDTQRRIIEMSAEGGVIDRLLDIIDHKTKNPFGVTNASIQRPNIQPQNNNTAPMA